jgi:hypothetical protein
MPCHLSRQAVEAGTTDTVLGRWHAGRGIGLRPGWTGTTYGFTAHFVGHRARSSARCFTRFPAGRGSRAAKIRGRRLRSRSARCGRLAPFTRLAAAAAVTTRLRLGNIVLSNDFRHPAIVAHQAPEGTRRRDQTSTTGPCKRVTESHRSDESRNLEAVQTSQAGSGVPPPVRSGFHASRMAATASISTSWSL